MDTIRPPFATLSSWRRIATVGVLFFALVAALAAYDVVRSHRETVDQTGRELSAGAVVIAEQAARSLQTIDIVLHHVATDYQIGRAHV